MGVDENKELVQKYYKALYSTDCDNAIDEFLSDTYIEHQANAGFAAASLKSFVKKRLEDHQDHSIVIHRCIAQGDHVFLHVEEQLSPNQKIARGELFRLENDKIVEHWGTEQAVPKKSKNNNGMFGGPDVNLETGIGPENVDSVKQRYLDGFVNYDFDTIRNGFTGRYIQHSPVAKDGSEALIKLLKVIKVFKIFGIKINLDIKRTVAEGDFVVTHSFLNAKPLISDSNVFDLLRLDKDGKIDEHWDVMENIKVKENIAKVF